MCHSHDDGISLTGSVEDIERKTFKNELACAVFRKRGGVWSFPILDMALLTVCTNAIALSGLRS